MKIFICILSFLFFWLQYSFWFGKHGVCDFFRIKNDIKIKKINNSRMELKFRNNRLISEINDFINNKEESVEERARSELGMIKSEEIFYYIIIVDRNISK